MEWFGGSCQDAIVEAKRNKKILLVYIEGTDDLSKSMTDTYNHVSIAEKLSPGNVVALKLVANSVPFKQFSAIYPVLIIPSSFFFGTKPAPLEIVNGALSVPEFLAKLNHIFEIYNAENKEAGSSIEAASSSKCSTSTVSPQATSSESVQQSPPTENSVSQVPLEDKVERAKALMEAKRQLKEQEEKDKEKQQELERRSVGKALQQLKKEQGDKELKEWAINRAKEKEEERQAREKVLAQIAQDKAERAARYQRGKDLEQEERERIVKIREEQEKAAKSAAFSSNEAHIQFRLPDGSATNHVFSADATLDDARQFVTKEIRLPFSHFSMCTTFPKRQFTVENYKDSLRDLQLAPSAVILILPDQSVSSVSVGGSFLSNIFWMLLTPFTSVWSLFTSFFYKKPKTDEQSSTSKPPPHQEASTSQGNNRSGSQSGARRRDARFVKREGNIYRINNQSDDDENNTWNGNSTQQM